jgi:hypothetical protein
MQMLIILGAIALGVVIGLALGGSLWRLADVHFRWWPLAIGGLALQLIPVPSAEGKLDHWLALGLLIASYVGLLVFVVANLRLPGFALVGVGFALNLLVISLNGGMPVNAHALEEASGSGYGAAVIRLDRNGGAKHHLARTDDVLVQLSDVIQVGWPVRNVFSAGDIVAMGGIAWVLAGATRGPTGRHRVPPSPDGVRPRHRRRSQGWTQIHRRRRARHRMQAREVRSGARASVRPSGGGATRREPLDGWGASESTLAEPLPWPGSFLSDPTLDPPAPQGD